MNKHQTAAVSIGLAAVFLGWLSPVQAYGASGVLGMPMDISKPPVTADTCAVTAPNRHPLPKRTADNVIPEPPLSWYGNGSVGTMLWPEGRAVFRPNGPGKVLNDGSLQMKFLWLKEPGARLAITGHRVDAPSIALRAQVDHQFDAADFQPSFLIFSGPGCWTVTADVGNASLTFITDVVRIDRVGAEPTPR